MQTTRFNLIDLMNDIMGMFQPFTDDKGIELGFTNYATSPFIVETDYTVLKQVLVNVISNAVKYTVEGSVNIKLKYDEQLIFRITDTGVGIDEEDISKIFKPFSRVNNPLKTEGSGFGLYVKKGLVEALKGSINLESEKGKGTRITIQLPIQPVQHTTKFSCSKTMCRWATCSRNSLFIAVTKLSSATILVM